MESNNQIYCKPAYRCGICGAEYPTVAERMKCEQACVKKQEEDIKRLAEEQKKAEQKARKAEVDEAMEHAYQLQRAYIKDYGSYSFKHVSNKSNQTDDVLTYPWHLFF